MLFLSWRKQRYSGINTLYITLKKIDKNTWKIHDSNNNCFEFTIMLIWIYNNKCFEFTIMLIWIYNNKCFKFTTMLIRIYNNNCFEFTIMLIRIYNNNCFEFIIMLIWIYNNKCFEFTTMLIQIYNNNCFEFTIMLIKILLIVMQILIQKVITIMIYRYNSILIIAWLMSINKNIVSKATKPALLVILIFNAAAIYIWVLYISWQYLPLMILWLR